MAQRVTFYTALQTSDYLSSSEYDNTEAWEYSFGGKFFKVDKTWTFYVRAVFAY
jgi:hypothetical protein